jgi:hypothetical protein
MHGTLAVYLIVSIWIWTLIWDVSGQSYMIQRYTQSQRNLNPSDFSIRTGTSETTRQSLLHLELARGSVQDVTLLMQHCLSLPPLSSQHSMWQKQKMGMARRSPWMLRWLLKARSLCRFQVVAHTCFSELRLWFWRHPAEFECCISPREKVAEDLILADTSSWCVIEFPLIPVGPRRDSAAMLDHDSCI